MSVPGIFDPRSNKFSRFNIPGTDKGVHISPIAYVTRLFTQLVAGKKAEEDYDDQTGLEQRLRIIEQGISSRYGQFLRAGLDVTRGTDFRGRAIDNKAAYVAKSILPIVGQQIAESLAADDDVLETILTAGIGFLGSNVVPLPVNEQLARYAKTTPEVFNEIQTRRAEHGVKSWDGNASTLLASERKRLAIFSEQGRRIAAALGSKDAQHKREKEIKFVAEQHTDDGEFHSDVIDGTKWRERRTLRQARLQQMRLDEDEEYKNIQREPRNDIERALKEYFDTFEKFVTRYDDDGQVKEVDFEGWNEAEARMRETWTQEQRGGVDLSLHPLATDTERQYLKDLDALITPYYRIQDSFVPSGKDQDMWRKYKSLGGGAAKRYLGERPELEKYVKDEKVRRALMRVESPALREVLARWGYLETANLPIIPRPSLPTRQVPPMPKPTPRKRRGRSRN